MNYSKIFDQKLNHDFARVQKIDFFKNAEILGIRQNNGSLIFDFSAYCKLMTANYFLIGVFMYQSPNNSHDDDFDIQPQ